MCRRNVCLCFVCVLRQEPVEIVRKRLLVSLAKGGGATAHFDTARAHGVQEVPHVQSSSDVLRCVHLTARAQRMTAFFNGFSSQWNVAGNDEVAGIHSFDDLVVSDVKALLHLDGRYVSGRRRIQRLVRDQRERDASALGGAEQDFLYDDRTSVGVYPDFHRC
jgi:hypothetical protein